MKKYVFAVVIIGSLATYLLVGCNGNKQDKNSSTTSTQDTSRDGLIANVKAVEEKMKGMQTLDAYTSNLAITAYITFANKFPSDTVAPKFLFKAANLAMTMGQYDRSLKLYDGICTKYPGFKYIPDCIFVQGFIYDTYMKDTAKAHTKYQQVITQYPDNNLAGQAKAAISALGKSDEELIKEFQEKNKKDKEKARS